MHPRCTQDAHGWQNQKKLISTHTRPHALLNADGSIEMDFGPLSWRSLRCYTQGPERLWSFGKRRVCLDTPAFRLPFWRRPAYLPSSSLQYKHPGSDIPRTISRSLGFADNQPIPFRGSQHIHPLPPRVPRAQDSKRQCRLVYMYWS